MKTILQISFLFLLLTQIHYPQWTNQNPVPDFNNLWSTFFVDDTTGWIVGSGGFIKKTTNAGNEWIQQNSGTTLILKAIQFVDQSTGWICGEAGLILKSTDGGASWNSLASGTTEHLSDIHFYDADTGYVVGFNGTILKTTNGGSYWTSLNSGTTNDLYAMDFVDAFIGYAAGEVNDTSSVIKTTDGGITWIDKSSGFPATSGNCLAVEFIDANTGFIRSYKTTDGGDTWGSSNSPFTLKEVETDTIDRLDIYPFSAGIMSIYFKDVNNGWRVHWSGTDNSIYSTTNGGITWEMEYRAWGVYNYAFLSVFVTPNGTGLAIGRLGLICMKENSSSEWSQLFSGRMDNIYSIHFVDENIGWAAGSRYGNPFKGIILKTTNGGKIFKTQVENGGGYRIYSVYFFNENLGWTVGEHLTYRTTDGGENWSSTGGSYSSSVYFINQNTGWRATYFNVNGIYKSTDGGITWILKSSASSSSVYFSDINIGWAVGAGGNILKSTDGGETWLTKTSGTANNLNWVRFYNSNIGMCVGNAGTVLLSTDGGETWISQNANTSENLTSVEFANSTTVWIAGYNGTILNTTDLGYNWASYDGVTENDLTSLSFINEYTGWIGGMSGTMFKFSVEPPTPPVWTNQITIEDAVGTESSQFLTFGQHVEATDGIDASLGEYELPPPPPTGIFDTRFNFPTNPPVSSLIDYRDSTKKDILWNMTFQPGSAGYPMTFTWDSTAFPAGTFYLKDLINGSFAFVNMKSQSSYTLTEPAISSLNISYRGLSKSVIVNNGWNMISVPLLAEDMTLSNLFPTATSLAYEYNGGYIAEDTLVRGLGYWLKFDGNEQIQIYGFVLGDTVSVQEGWNMIGGYEEDILISQITTTPPGIVATFFFGYDDGYYIADTLKSGQGFWVRVTSDGVINLNGGALEKDGEQQQIVKIDQNWGRVIITDNGGKSITLYATEQEIESDYFYELPPMPPTGIFDARYSSGRMAEDLSNETIIQITSDKYPITIKAEGINLTVKDIINGELLNAELKSGEEIRIVNSKITSIEVTGRITGGLPVSYELFQNYPNPFNPSTTIKFAVPIESNVNLSIYNVLGELITTLVKEQLKAGYYEYDFNASSLASGVYLFRIKAGDPSSSSQNGQAGQSFVETKKMILIK